MSTMNGSELSNKYKRVHFGSLVNFDERLPVVNHWLKNNLFYRVDMSNVKRSKLLSIDNDYLNIAGLPKNS